MSSGTASSSSTSPGAARPIGATVTRPREVVADREVTVVFRHACIGGIALLDHTISTASGRDPFGEAERWNE